MSTRGPIRVLHLRDSPWVDGPGRTILETASRIDRRRVDYQIAPLVPDDGARHPLVVAARERGVPVLPILDTRPLAPLVERVTGLVDRLGIEILHSSEFRTNLVALQCRRRRPGLKLVSTAHGWIANDLRGRAKVLLGKALLRRFDRVILVSEAMRQRLPRWWIPDERVRVIHNALAIERYDAGTSGMQRRPPRDGSAAVLAVGRLSAEKGFDLLLDAVASLAPEWPGLRLAIAGIGPLEQSLRSQAARLGIEDRVTWLGYASDMPRVYERADLVVQSSLTEGLPNVMLEAAWLGVPVVATDVGGTREVIRPGVGGWLIRPGSAREIADGIRRFLERPDEFLAMTRRSRDHIAELFSLDARTEKQTACYEELA
jgi:glycosyltransferase involved in cell wall biosynthesis